MTARAEPNDGDGQAIFASNSFEHAITEHAASLVHGFRVIVFDFDSDYDNDYDNDNDHDRER